MQDKNNLFILLTKANSSAKLFRMATKQPLRLRMETLKINGIPIFVDSYTARINAHNIATSMGIEIKTRERIGQKGYEIFRTK